MRKLISKSNGLLGGLLVLKDNDRANVLLNCGHAFGDCGLFGMRTSLLCKFVSMLVFFVRTVHKIPLKMFSRKKIFRKIFIDKIQFEILENFDQFNYFEFDDFIIICNNSQKQQNN